MLFFRNKLWREEALFFALLPDISFLLIMAYVLLGTPMDVGWWGAMQTIPPIYKQFYFFMHSFVAVGIAAIIIWRLRPKLLPALSGWFLHICMDIPVHDGEFATHFLYPIFPNVYIESSLSWTDYRVLGITYLLLLNFMIYSLWRERKKHRMGDEWKTDWLDKIHILFGKLYSKIPAPVPIPQVQLAGSLINKKLTSTANAARGYFQRTPDKLSGEDQNSPGQGED
ncbi:MAG: hypothetical protein KAR56_01115 [Thermoplasmata archaeon]|nr:hypothetical protein [Thermoplasmata archaeon]